MTGSPLERLTPRVDPADRDRRQDLAAAFRLLAAEGLDDTIYTHASARVPGVPDAVYINPYGMLYEDVTASRLIPVALDSLTHDPPPAAINPAAIAIHAAIYAARPDLVCVIHSHSLAGTTVAAMEGGLLPINQISLEFYNRIAVHDYEGPAANPAEKKRLASDLGERNAMILRNHGLLTAGRSVAEAFYLMYHLERACRIQVAALGSGQQLRLAYPAMAEYTARQFDSVPDRGLKLWEALRRRLDRIDPSYMG